MFALQTMMYNLLRCLHFIVDFLAFNRENYLTIIVHTEQKLDALHGKAYQIFVTSV